jgi:hypothetical protein
VKRPLVERFWAMVQKTDGCWVWRGSTRIHGYGVLWISRGRGWQERAHRLSFLLHSGLDRIPDGKWVLHRCDNRACVNPAHLYLGDILQNTADMVGRNRQAKGERQAFAKLTEQDVKEIRQGAASGVPKLVLARTYGVSHKAIRLVVARKTWKHVV